MTPQITTGNALAEKLKTRYDNFTFPVLDITIKYRKPDLLKLSLNKSLPQAMSDAVIAAYKEAVNGGDTENQTKNAILEASDELIKDVDEKGYILLKELCVSHKILDVPESDPENDLISWSDIPEEDAIAFLLHVIQKAQKATTALGGEISTEEITEFPVSKRGNKRSPSGKDGEIIREPSE